MIEREQRSTALHLLLLLQLLLSLAIPHPARAEAVSARVGQSSWGQAWTFRTPAGCAAALPRHVSEHFEELAEPILRSRTGRVGQGLTPVQPDAALDLVFVEVVGELADPCGSPENLGVDRLEFILRDIRNAQFEYFSRSEFATVPVEILRSTDQMIAIRPVHEADKLKQSMSGGTVLDDSGRPLGMVLKVITKRNTAQALRFDVIKRKSKAFARSATAASSSRTSARPIDGWTLVEWSGKTIDSSRGPMEALSGGSWIVEGNAAELVLSSKERVTLAGLVLTRGTPSSEAASAVQSLAIHTRRSETAPWVLAHFCRAETDEGPLDCRIAPRKASQIKLAFGAPDAQALEIHGLELVLEPEFSR